MNYYRVTFVCDGGSGSTFTTGNKPSKADVKRYIENEMNVTGVTNIRFDTLNKEQYEKLLSRRLHNLNKEYLKCR